MAKEVNVQELPGAGLNLGDVFRYGDLVMKVVGIGSAVKSLGVGSELEPGLIKFKIEGKRFEWDSGTLKRVG